MSVLEIRFPNVSVYAALIIYFVAIIVAIFFYLAPVKNAKQNCMAYTVCCIRVIFYSRYLKIFVRL